MLHKLTPTQYDNARAVFQSMDDHLAITALLDGSAPGHVYVDDPTHPCAALAQVKYRYHLAGSPDNPAFNAALGRLFAETIYPQALATGAAMFSLAYAPETWQRVIETIILRDKQIMHAQREYYEGGQPKHDWRTLLPPGFELHHVDEALLAKTHLRHLDALKEEMCSERPSVQDFLAKSFGVCLVYGDELAGWCLSEYNSGHRCEVGIETVEPYRRRDLATAMSCALLELARARGITQVGWHCWKNNTPSAATALKAGLHKVCDYPVYYAWFAPRPS